MAVWPQRLPCAGAGHAGLHSFGETMRHFIAHSIVGSSARSASAVAFAALRRSGFVLALMGSHVAFAQPVAPAPASPPAPGVAPVATPPAVAATATGAVGGVTSATPAAPAADAPKEISGDDPEVEREWRDRDRDLAETNTLTGSTGLLRLQHATVGVPGQFRLGFSTEWFSAGFLCTPEFPCANPRGTGKIVTGSSGHMGASLTLGVTVAKLGSGGLETWLSTSAYANSHDGNRPGLLQVLGDSTLGVKYAAPVGDVFRVGGAMEMLLVNGSGSVGLVGGATSARFSGLASADLRGTQAKTPLRFSMNMTYFLDNSAAVLSDIEKPIAQGGRGAPVTRIERFGLKINRVDQFQIAFGGEYFAAEGKVRPFLEYQMGIPTNRQDYACKPTNASKDNCLANVSVIPSTLTIGGRFAPWKPGFSLLAALDLGLTGTASFIEELAPVAPWTIHIGAGWAIDTQTRPPIIRTKISEKIVQVAPPSHGKLLGFVHEQGKQEGVANAIVAFANHAELNSLATGKDGRFTTSELPDGAYQFHVSADGYKDGTCEAQIVNSKDSQVDCQIEALPKVGSVAGMLRDSTSNTPLAGVVVRLIDAQHKEITQTTDASGNFRFEGLVPGSAELHVAADGYLADVESVEVKARHESHHDLLVRAKPKNGLIAVGAKEISLKQQVQFATDSATILPASFPLLTEIADVLIREQRIKRVEIQGHTDNVGGADLNKRLSETRAESVKEWLVKHGVEGSRLSSAGFGASRPLNPNVTAAMRARNRRVQVVIVEQDKPTPKPH